MWLKTNYLAASACFSDSFFFLRADDSPLLSYANKISLVKNVQHLWISLNDSDPDRYQTVMQMPFAKTIQ